MSQQENPTHSNRRWRRKFLVLLLFIALGVISYGLGISLGTKQYEAKLLKEYGAISNMQSNTELQKSPKAQH